MNQDIRWIQRFSNYKKALAQLEAAVKISIERQLSDLENQGMIQGFEYTHELAWNTLKDYLAYQGNNSIKGSRDATREAFKVELIYDGEAWMDMIKSRNQSSHTYNEDTAHDIVTAIINTYYPLFTELQTVMQSLMQKEIDENEIWIKRTDNK
ncbi:nucleotidyltransferase substrate binding protein [Candidatus Marithrix sp. Canyon 246]|uniref:nucleotidyltransferase substrate binding protein n=2 Tax=Candidatus Marithrix sp. Canyon 246 TaxID=1827136 RepID=UPI000849FDCC|nr:nucleotidyltransferase substrate binding protein [Candidatus Marithrix sp. Canyon 246]